MKAKWIRIGAKAAVLLAIVLLLSARSSRAAPAATCTWTGNVSTDWATSGNWSSCQGGGGLDPPASGDTATINSGGNQPTISSAVTIAGLTLNTGATLTISSNTLTVNGNITMNADGGATTTLSNSGTLTQGSGIMTLSRTAVAGTANINLSGTGTWNINNLTTSSTTTNYNLANGATYNVAGDITRSGGTLVPGTSTVVMTGSGKQLKGGNAHTYYNLTIGAGASVTNPSGSIGNVTISKDLTVAGTFTQDASRSITFNFAGTSNLTGGGTITFGSVTVSGGTTLNAGTQAFSVAGATWQVSSGGTFDGSSATVTFDATSTTIDGTGTHTFNNVVINSGKILTNAANNRPFSVKGNWTNNGTYTAGTETVTFNKSGTQTFSGNTTFNNLTINSGSIVDTGTSLATVNGTYTNNGQLRHTDTKQIETSGTFKDGTNITTTVLSNGTALFGSTTVNSAAGSTTNPYDNCGALPNAVKRYWQITVGTGGSATVKFTYRASEINGRASDALFIFKCPAGGATNWGTSVGTNYNYMINDPVAGYNSVQADNVNLGSTFVLDEKGPTAATVVRFEAKPDFTGVTLEWQTASEPGVAGFQIERSLDGTNFSALGDFVFAQGSAVSGATYAVRDDTLKPGEVATYRLVEVSSDGGRAIRGSVRASLTYRFFLPLIVEVTR